MTNNNNNNNNNNVNYSDAYKAALEEYAKEMKEVKRLRQFETVCCLVPIALLCALGLRLAAVPAATYDSLYDSKECEGTHICN